MTGQIVGKDLCEALEELVRQVQGVIAVRIVSSDDGQLEEIHILADTSRSPKQIIRDIESFSMVQLGLKIDYRKISLVQVQDRDLPAEHRVKLSTISFSRTVHKTTVTVELTLEEKAFTGEAGGLNTTGNQLRLVAQATIKALENCLGIQEFFALEEVKQLALGGREVVTVAISAVGGSGNEEALVGIASVDSDCWVAASKAVLAAINRRLTRVIKGKKG
jgi:hypothetical protein